MPDPPWEVLADVVRQVTGADRVELSVPGRRVVATSGTEVAGGGEPTVFQVTDADGPLAELRVHGSTYARLCEVLPLAASLLALLAARERQAPLERAWVGRLGHDLKTPLTVVLGFAGLLSGGGVVVADPELVDAATRVTVTGERLLADLEEDLVRWRTPRP